MCILVVAWDQTEGEIWKVVHAVIEVEGVEAKGGVEITDIGALQALLNNLIEAKEVLVVVWAPSVAVEVAEAKEEVEVPDLGAHQAQVNNLKEVHVVVWALTVVVVMEANVRSLG